MDYLLELVNMKAELSVMVFNYNTVNLSPVRTNHSSFG